MLSRTAFFLLLCAACASSSTSPQPEPEPEPEPDAAVGGRTGSPPPRPDGPMPAVDAAAPSAEVDASTPRDSAPATSDGPRPDVSTADARPANGSLDAPAGYKPTIVAVGYGGVRILSRDLGQTWGDRSSIENALYGNENNLLRVVGWGAGLYVAAGQLIYTSRDGATWTERRNTMGNWLGGVVYGNGMFGGGGGCGWTIRSADGLTWTRSTSVTNQNCPTGSHRRSGAFGNGQFALAGDNRVVYVSPDTARWTVLPGVSASQVVFCNGAFRDRAACPSAGSGHGIFLRVRANNIDRSTDGNTWRTVHRDTNVFVSFTFGFSP